MYKITLLAGLLLLMSMRPVHPLKMCVCHTKYHPESGRLGLTFRFFWDDLERALEQQTGRDLNLTQITAENNRLLTDFVLKQFDLKINRQHIQLQHTASSLEDVVLIVEFVATSFAPASVYDIDLRNQILLHVFPDQYNMVRFDFFGDGNLETMRFERAEQHLVKRIVRNK